MKRVFAIALLLVGVAVGLGVRTVSASAPAGAQTQQHRVVFELTSDDLGAWDSVLNNAENVRESLGPATSVEVVTHGKGLAMLTAAKAGPVFDRLKATSDRGVIFAACENTMRREGIGKQALVPFARTVDSGVGEVVRKQEAGWSYVRTGN